MSDENQQLKPGVVGGMENHIFELRAKLESAKAEVERLKKTYEHHLLGCAAQDQFLLEIGLVDTSGDEWAGCWENALANELKSELTATRAKLAEAEGNSFWKDIIVKDGAIDVAQVKLELEDYRMILDNVSAVYTHITGNKISKANADSSAVIAVADDHIEELIQEALEEAQGKLELSNAELVMWNKQALARGEQLTKLHFKLQDSPTIPAALVDKLEGAATGLAREVASIHRGHSDPAFKFPCEIVWESALAELQAFRNGGKV